MCLSAAMGGQNFDTGLQRGDRLRAMASGGVYTGEERRKVERYRVNLRARWEGKREWRDGSVTDISVAGCFVLTGDLVEPGQLVRIEILQPGGVITLWGHVIYTAEEIGFGVRFSPFFPEEERRKLDMLVTEESLRPQKGRGR